MGKISSLHSGLGRIIPKQISHSLPHILWFNWSEVLFQNSLVIVIWLQSILNKIVLGWSHRFMKSSLKAGSIDASPRQTVCNTSPSFHDPTQCLPKQDCWRWRLLWGDSYVLPKLGNCCDHLICTFLGDFVLFSPKCLGLQL